MKIKHQVKCELARREFWSYCNLMASDFYKADRQYLIDLCNEMQDFYNSFDEVLIINAPPRHGKSRTATLFVQWVLGQDVNNKIMTGSYNETLSTTFSKAVRNRIQEGKASDDILVYSDVFPNVKVKRGDGASNLWGLEGTGTNSYLATSPTGTATGFGADIILIDDIIKNEYEARTESILDKHYSWYTDTLFSRLEGKRKLILIMTRWATSDLAGRIISDCEKNGEPYRLLSFKAYDGENMLCDDVLDYEHYKKISDNISNEIMQANYNQQPIDVQGVLYPELKTYEQLPELSQIKCYVDTADTGTDYLCSIIYGIGLKDNLNYILDVVYTQQGMEITEPLVAERLNAYNVNICAIESNNGGRGFARNVQTHLKQMGNTITKIRWFTQTKNKQARILTGSTGVMNTILFPFDWHKRWREFYRDVTRYQRAGKNAHDDSVDCLTGVYEMTPKKKQSENINPAFM